MSRVAAIRLSRITSIIVLAFLLFLPLPEWWTGGWRSKLLDFGHVPLFAALVLIWSIPGRSPTRAVVLAIALAGLAEVVQGLIGRTADWEDFLRGALGAAAGAATLWGWRARRRPGRLIACLALVAALVAWPVFDFGPWLIDAYEGYQEFPVIADFHTHREVRRWASRQAELQRIYDAAASASWVGRLDFHPGPEPYPTAAIAPIIRDFRGYGQICFSFEVIGGPLNLVISIRGGPLVDGHTTHSQFGRLYASGPQLVRMSLAELANLSQGRPLDLGDVRTIQFFVIRPTEVRTILIRGIWLEQ